MATSSSLSIVDEFEKLSASLEEEFDESKGHALALRDWSLLSNWVMQYIEEAKSLSGFMEEIAEKDTLAERVGEICAVESIRVDMETAAEEMLNVCELKEQKNVDKAHIFLSIGLKFYDREVFDRAIQMFNKSLQFCPQPQDMGDDKPVKYKNMFAMILANRCRVFSVQKRYDQSLADLDAAIKYAIDPVFAEGLFEAREELVNDACESGFEKIIYEPERYEIASEFENKGITGAVNILRMSYKARIGRHIVTTARVRKGVSVISEIAFAHWLAPSFYAYYCAHCMRPLNDQPFPCRFCIYFRFCNENCYEESWQAYHGVECKFMPILKYFANGHLALRTILTNGIEESLKDYREVMSKQKFPVECRMIYLARLKDVLTFITHEELIDKFMTTATFTAAFLTVFCRSLRLFEDEDIEDFGGLILKLLAIIRVNSLLISDNTKKDEDGDEFVSSYHRRAEIGAGLFGATSFLNHSCEHNCDRVFIGNRMIISANRDIDPMEEITITYGPNKERLGYRERQQMILDRYFFKCICPACLRKS